MTGFYDVIEADHGKLKRLIKSALNFKFLKTAYAGIKRFEEMRALKKKQEGVKVELPLIEPCF